MPTIGPLELLVVGIIALIVFGPDKLPGMARQLGKVLHELRQAANDVKSEITSGLEDDESFDMPDTVTPLPPPAEAMDEPETPEPARPQVADADSEET